MDILRPGRCSPRAAYLHVPFCFHKCHYCDFYSFVDSHDRRPEFTDRLVRDIENHSSWIVEPLKAIFVGGGTPTLLEPDQWIRILEAVSSHWPCDDDLEWTVEANPETITPELLAVLRDGGVSRLSIGAQSFDPVHLQTLERHHDPANVVRAASLARDAGIENVNLDLIFAIPGQTLDDWKADLDAALELNPSHISAYSLMYEPNTALTQRLRSGAVQRVDEDVEAAMYEHTIDRLAEAGFDHYEISNWAVPGRTCRHNLIYWTNESWLALGPSASGHLDGVRWKNRPRLADYLANEPWMPIEDAERLDDDGRVGEQLMLGFRLIEGIPNERLEQWLNDGERGADRRDAIERTIAAGHMERSASHTRLTRAGLLLADSILAELI